MAGVDDPSGESDEATRKSFAELAGSEPSPLLANPPTSPNSDTHAARADGFERGEAEERRRWLMWMEEDTGRLRDVDRAVTAARFVEHGPRAASTYQEDANRVAMTYGQEWVVRTAWTSSAVSRR